MPHFCLGNDFVMKEEGTKAETRLDEGEVKLFLNTADNEIRANSHRMRFVVGFLLRPDTLGIILLIVEGGKFSKLE